MEKKCSKCKKIKPASEFYLEKRFKDGFQSECKQCFIIRTKKWASKNIDKVKEYKKKWKKFNPKKIKVARDKWIKDNPEQNKRYKKNWREANLGYQKEWTKKNPERRKEITKKGLKKYRKIYPERVKMSIKKWAQANPEKIRMINKKHSAKRRGALGSHTLEQWKILKNKYNNCCAICGRQEPFTDLWYQFLTEDHISPISKGGSNFIENIQPLCIYCNGKKGVKN